MFTGVFLFTIGLVLCVVFWFLRSLPGGVVVGCVRGVFQLKLGLEGCLVCSTWQVFLGCSGWVVLRVFRVFPLEMEVACFGERFL